MIQEILTFIILYLFIAFLFAVIHFAVLEVAETRINVAKMIFWPLTIAWYIIYAVLWLLFSLFLLLKEFFSEIIILVKKFQERVKKINNLTKI